MRSDLSLRKTLVRGTVFAALALGACARIGPPAPVIRGGGQPQYAPPERQASLPSPASVPARPSASARPRSVIVAPGQSIYSIARDSGVPLRALIDANHLHPPFAVTPGQRLVLPLARYHIVQHGDTLYGISRKYGIDMRSIIQANGIPPPYGIAVGQKLKLPVGGQPVRTAAAAPAADDRAPVTTATLPPTQAPMAAAAAPPPAETASLPPPPAALPAPDDVPPPSGGGQFMWPVRGRVLLGFGPRSGGLHNDGINIAASEGTAIHAAADGVVVYAGNELQGFGNLLLIRHAGDMMTAYAHASTILVKRGEHVRRGQVVARVGRTGNVSVPQLHFEIRRHDKPVDPMDYLAHLARGPSSVVTATVSPDARRDPE